MPRWNKPSLSLGTWIYLALLATVVAAALPLLWIVHSHVKAHAEQQAGSALRQVAWEMRDSLDRGMERHFEEMTVLAELQRRMLLDDPVSARQTLDAVQRSFPDFAWIGYADTQGTVLASTGGLLKGENVAARPWFKGAQQAAFVGDIHPAVLLEKLLPKQAEPLRFVDVALPIRDDAGQLRGVLGMHLSWSWARNVHRSLIDPAQDDRAAQVLVLRQDGTVILGPTDSEGSKIDLALYGRVAPGGAALAVQEHETSQNYRETEFSAMARTQGHGRYPGLGWVVLVRQPGVVAMASYDTLSRKVLAAGFAVAVAVLLGGLILTQRLSQPLRKLRNVVEDRTHHDRITVADEAAEGDARGTGGLGLPPVRGYLEVNQLSDALVAMVAEEDRLTRELVAINATLEERVQQQTAESRLRATRLRDITDNLPVLISYIDSEERLQFINATSTQWLGMAPEAMMGRNAIDVFGAEVYAQRRENLLRALAGERVQFEMALSTLGQHRLLRTTYVPDRDIDGQVAGVYTLSHDITAAREAELQLQALARVDTLTRLPNRYSFNEKLPEALARARRQGNSVALMFLDVDHFKSINDNFGHAVGDAVLVEFAQRLSSSVRVTDTVARLAGDEFVIVLEGLRGEDEAQLVARKIVDSLQRPFELAERSIQVSSSIGIAFHGEGAVEPAHLLARADSALYAAKAAGRNTFRSLAS